MKNLLFPLLLMPALYAGAQKTTTYYNFQRRPTVAAYARFISTLEHTDAGWHLLDFYAVGPLIHMEATLHTEAWYEDSACKIANGKFISCYPDKKLEATGQYAHGKKQGLWLSYHPNGNLADSTVYAAGLPVGTSKKWHIDGGLYDSSVSYPDSSGIEVRWFANGNPSSAGRWAPGHKRQGRWKFFHSNGQLSALELYDHDQLLQKEYFDEKGQRQADTTTRDQKSYFGPNPSNWRDWHNFLQENLEYPENFHITNSDSAAVEVTFWVDEDGKVKYPYISVPFYEAFNKEVMTTFGSRPKWHPAIDHNRRVPSGWSQAIIFYETKENMMPTFIEP